MGGVDKGLLPWGTSTLAAEVVRRLRPQVGTLLISCNRNVKYYRTLAEVTVGDTRRNFQGPLSGLEAAIPHIRTEFLIIAPCDAPLLPADLVGRLMNALNQDSKPSVDICYAHDGKRGQYLCAAMRSRCLASLPAYLDTGQRAVRDWYAGHYSIEVDFSSQESSFCNINEPGQQA
jgi:molybdenum cofactor guanylyltransferase